MPGAGVKQPTATHRQQRQYFLHAAKKTKKCSALLGCFLVFLLVIWTVGWHQYERHDSKKASPSATNQEDLLREDSLLQIVFSTDCSAYQDWQTLLLFHSAKLVKQKGKLTRIASGCTDHKKREKLKQLYKILHPEYSIHFTPDYKRDAKTNKKYDFYNKPYGLLHWMQKVNPPLQNNAIIALIDPDFIFLRPLSVRVAGQPNVLLSSDTDESQLIAKVEKGKPVAQNYGLGASWASDHNQKLNRTKICGSHSPCHKVQNPQQGTKYYSVGAPYLLARDDMLRLAQTWVDFVPRVYEGYPSLLAEMFAYSMAAAHEELPHLRLDGFMVSNVDMDAEGWPFIDAWGRNVTLPPDELGLFFPGSPLPTFAHYCQFYRAAKIGFHKRRVFGDIFSCGRGLFVDIPRDLSSADHKEREGGEIVPQSRKQVQRSSFMLSVIHHTMNSALREYKRKMCGATPNMAKSINLAFVKY